MQGSVLRVAWPAALILAGFSHFLVVTIEATEPWFIADSLDLIADDVPAESRYKAFTEHLTESQNRRPVLRYLLGTFFIVAAIALAIADYRQRLNRPREANTAEKSMN